MSIVRPPSQPPRHGDPTLNCWACHMAGGTWELDTDLNGRYWLWTPCAQCGGRGHVYFAPVREAT